MVLKKYLNPNNHGGLRIPEATTVIDNLKMKFLLFIALFIPLSVNAVNCFIDDYEVDVYDHGGTYIHGKLVAIDGAVKSAGFIPIHVENDTKGASDRRLSIALAGQMSGKRLNAYFSGLNTCNDYTNYTAPNSIRIER